MWRFVGVVRMLITTLVVPSSRILSTLKIEATRPFETPVSTGPTLRHIPEDGIVGCIFVGKYSQCFHRNTLSILILV
jgi:hypothetical protein